MVSLSSILKDSAKYRADISTRPTRFAFVIRDDLSTENLMKVLEYNSLIWGGYYNLLLPTNGETIEDGWWHNLLCLSPDKIVYCSNDGDDAAFSDLMRLTSERVQPFHQYRWNTWNGDVVEVHQQAYVDWFDAVPMVYPYRHWIEKLREPIPPDRSHVQIAKVETDNPFYECIMAQVGSAKGMYEEGLTESFGARLLEFGSRDIEDYLHLMSDLQKSMTPLLFTQYQLSAYSSIGFDTKPEGLTVVPVGDNLVEDICVFWSLRLAPLFPSRERCTANS